MTTLSTTKKGHRNVYSRTDTDNRGRVTLERECDLSVVQGLVGGKTVFTLLDENGNTNTDVGYYVNKKMVDDGRSSNSRRKSAQVLCKLYSFLSLMGYDVHTLGESEIGKLVEFLRGTGRTQCSNETVNAYLGIIREYFRCCNIECKTLFHQHVLAHTDVKENDFRVDNTYYTFDVNLPTNPHKYERVPKYISLDLYIRLQEIAKKYHDKTGIILMHLMFRYGMRLGECLGLTEEDIIISRIKGKDIPTLILRNRLSDAPDQHAKRKLIPRNESDYQGDTYIKQWEKDDYSHIYLTESTDFVQVFEKYVKDSHERAESQFKNNYKSCEADIVHPDTFREKKLKKNHYIFVNRLGKRLSAQMWGQTLKRYFIEAGIPLDIGKKDNNLSHRFRHGFAMMHARFMDPPVPAQELQKMMRHRNLSSTMIYYNPTQEDELEYKTALQNKFYDQNPKLKRILDSFLDDKL